MVSNDGGPAFPVDGVHPIAGGLLPQASSGMTLRDYFAAHALPAIIAAYVEANGRCIGSDHVRPNCAAHAYKFADAMLEARKQ